MRNSLASVAVCAGLVTVGLVGGMAMRTQAQPAPAPAPPDTAALRAQYEKWRTEFKTWGRWAPLGQESKGTTSLITPEKVASAMKLVKEGIVEARAYDQIETFAAGVNWARTEGVIPAPETNHVIAAVVQEAERAKQEGKEKVILFNFSGHGIIDLSAYDAFLSGKLTQHHLSDEEIARALKSIENLPKP